MKFLFYITIPIFLYSVSFNLELPKKQILLNEPILAKFIFNYNSTNMIKNISFEELQIENFKVNYLNKKIIKNNNYNKIIYYYLLTPQKLGTNILQPQIIHFAKRENKTNFIVWNKLYSKKTKVDILPIPNNQKIIGDFTLNTHIDQKTIKQNQPINFTINIKGQGNIEDIEPFKLFFNNAIIFSSEPTIKTIIKNNNYEKIFTQKFSILTKNSLTIPSLKIIYFNNSLKMNQTLITKPLHIKVLNEAILFDKYTKYFYIFIGFFIGIISMYYFMKNTKKKILHGSLTQKIKNAKTTKELYNILLPYANNIKIQQFLEELETTKKHNIKYFKTYLKSLDII